MPSAITLRALTHVRVRMDITTSQDLIRYRVVYVQVRSDYVIKLRKPLHTVWKLRYFLLMIFREIGKCVVCISSSILCVTRLVVL